VAKVYNTTDLDPEKSFERHIFHRDQFAHYLRWSHILKEAKIGETIVDFGCGKGELLEVLYRNRYKPKAYYGFDIRESTIETANKEYENLKFPVHFIAQDLIKPTYDLESLQADRVVSFEVAEHIGKQNIDTFLANFKKCGSDTAIFYLSTPNYDEHTGAAGNHTYDSGDGRGVAPQELEYFELRDAIENAGFEIVQPAHVVDESFADGGPMFNALVKYYDSNLVANLMAPVIDAVNARNILWVLKKGQS